MNAKQMLMAARDRLNQNAVYPADVSAALQDIRAADTAVADLAAAVAAVRATRGGIIGLGAQDARTVRLWAALARVQGEA